MFLYYNRRQNSANMTVLFLLRLFKGCMAISSEKTELLRLTRNDD